MNTALLKKFAQEARKQLITQVGTKLEQVLKIDSAEMREKQKAIQELKDQISLITKAQVIEQVAYTWFNRFCALRFMDVNRYTRLGVVSPLADFTQPEILLEAKKGYIDDSLNPFLNRKTVLDLLQNRMPSRDPQQEAYRLLLVAVCNYYNTIMPFMFERIADYTELLMPDDLLSDNSIIKAIRDVMTPESCQDVEIIGWLYQYYISERKDEVFANLKQNKKIEAKDIPAATQLFTPHWIVQYLTENSLGRLWLLNHPESNLSKQMAYYIPDDPAYSYSGEDDYLQVRSPEEIRICDPACGSGHMLVYAFDLLSRIYEESGYEAPEIPGLILEKNLFGMEIDERAGELAAFALFMKARGKYNRFFQKPVQPNICVIRPTRNVDTENLLAALERSDFDLEKLPVPDGQFDFVNEVDLPIFMVNHQRKKTTLLSLKLVKLLLELFEQADNFGSLIRIPDDIKQILPSFSHALQQLPQDQWETNLALKTLRELICQTKYLADEYHIVIANPPYMGGKGMNEMLKKFLQDEYTDVKSDLFSAFIVRNTELCLPKGHLGYMSPFVWMFISSYEKLRTFLIDKKTITSLIQLEYSGFEGATVPVCTFTLENYHRPDYQGGYVRLSDFRGSDIQGPKALEIINNYRKWLKGELTEAEKDSMLREAARQTRTQQSARGEDYES